MEKKKGKKKKKKSKKRSDGPKESSKKSILEAKVAELDIALATASRDLEEQESILETWTTLLREEAEGEEACVSHLQRILKAKTDEGVEAQEKLTRLKEGEREARQKYDQISIRLENQREQERSNFSQRLSELEDKFSGLEQKRQERLSLLERLKKVEETLANKTAAQLAKERQPKWTDCQDAAEHLLSAQDQNRHLKHHQELLQVKEEVQDLAEKDIKSLARIVLDRLDDLLRGKDIHRPVEMEYMRVMKLEIEEMEREMEQVQTEIVEENAILEDQEHYRVTLEKEIEKNSDKNGLLASKILRAHQVFNGRVGEIQDPERADMDSQVLHQIRMILEDK